MQCGVQYAGRAEQEQMAELLERLIRRGMVLRCERAFKKPKPGKNGRPLKWPKKLVRCQTQVHVLPWLQCVVRDPRLILDHEHVAGKDMSDGGQHVAVVLPGWSFLFMQASCKLSQVP